MPTEADPSLAAYVKGRMEESRKLTVDIATLCGTAPSVVVMAACLRMILTVIEVEDARECRVLIELMEKTLNQAKHVCILKEATNDRAEH